MDSTATPTCVACRTLRPLRRTRLPNRPHPIGRSGLAARPACDPTWFLIVRQRRGPGGRGSRRRHYRTAASDDGSPSVRCDGSSRPPRSGHRRSPFHGGQDIRRMRIERSSARKSEATAAARATHGTRTTRRLGILAPRDCRPPVHKSRSPATRVNSSVSGVAGVITISTARVVST
jgi:hypothetical protein